MNLWEKFEVWHNANPHVWNLFVRFALEAVQAGRMRFSARDIVHRIRWHTNIELRPVDEFKINNNWSPYYARIFNMIYPQHAKLFELRGVDDDPVVRNRIAAKLGATPEEFEPKVELSQEDWEQIFQA